MERTEAEQACKKLGEINLAIWDAPRWDGRKRRQLKAEFKALWKTVAGAGWSIGRGRVDGKPVFWIKGAAVPVGAQKKHCEFFELYDPRPAGVTLKCDCTTRALCACLGEDWREMRREQDELACRLGSKWNRSGTWDQVLLKRGWAYVSVRRGTERWEIARAIKDIPCAVCTVSSRHAAACKGGKVLDRWESQNGRVTRMIVPKAYKAQIIEKMRYWCILPCEWAQ